MKQQGHTVWTISTQDDCCSLARSCLIPKYLPRIHCGRQAYGKFTPHFLVICDRDRRVSGTMTLLPLVPRVSRSPGTCIKALISPGSSPASCRLHSGSVPLLDAPYDTHLSAYTGCVQSVSCGHTKKQAGEMNSIWAFHVSRYTNCKITLHVIAQKPLAILVRKTKNRYSVGHTNKALKCSKPNSRQAAHIINGIHLQ